MVMKSFSATSRSVACSASVGLPCLLAGGKLRETPRIDSSVLIGRAAPTGTARRLTHLKPRSLTSPIRPMTMMPKMIWSVASSAWLSVIMWPMPLDAPISSATIT